MKKGLFWFYNFDDSLFTYAVPSDNDESLSFENCWEKVSGPLALAHTHKFLPRGRVTITEGKAYIYLTPEIDRDEIKELIRNEFDINNSIEAFFIPDESEEYACVFAKDVYCTLCGKRFGFWDYEGSCQFFHRTSRYSQYPQKTIDLLLCYSCTEDLIEYVFSKGYSNQ